MSPSDKAAAMLFLNARQSVTLSRARVLAQLEQDASCPAHVTVLQAAAHLLRVGLTVTPAEVVAIVGALKDPRVQSRADYVAELSGAILGTALPQVSWRSVGRCDHRGAPGPLASPIPDCAWL